jgi:type VI secretion system protein ImpA
MLDLQTLLSEAKEASPCGPNLEHEPVFFELEEAARGKRERGIGTTLVKAEDPDWPKVAELAHDLLVRSKDLRIALHLTRACTKVDGVPGLAAGLELLHGLLERYWDGVYPLLEADAGGDPTERLSALAPLSESETVIEAETVIRDLRSVFLINSREHGQLQAREVEIACGRLAAPAGVPSKTLSEIHVQLATAFSSDRAVPAALREARDRVLAIETLLVERVGATRAIDLKPLAQCLGSLLEACDTALGVPTLVPRDSAGPEVAMAVVGARAIDGPVSTREEAVRVLDLVCSYLEKHEPSNPAPLFIRRAQRLMTKNFVEIVKDLIPDSLANLERLAGSELDKKK